MSVPSQDDLPLIIDDSHATIWDIQALHTMDFMPLDFLPSASAPQQHVQARGAQTSMHAMTYARNESSSGRQDGGQAAMCEGTPAFHVQFKDHFVAIHAGIEA